MKLTIGLCVALLALSNCGPAREKMEGPAAANSHVIYSPDKRMKFEARKKDNDIYLTLSRIDQKADSVSWKFSEICAVSTSKPWNLESQSFLSVSLAGSLDSVLLTGRTGCFETELAFSFQGDLLRLSSQWLCVSPVPLENTSVALVLELSHDPATERVTMPHILYNDNQSADPARLVPHFGKDPGACLLCEETRFPIPCVNVEWLKDSIPLFVSLHSIPESDSLDWSLGCIRLERGLRVICASGILALNGKKDETYGGQCKSVPFESGYHYLKKGDRLEKTCFIEFGEAERIGWGFRNIVSSGYEIHRPEASAVLHLDRVIELKANALDSRWRSDAKSCGFLCVVPGSPGNVFKRPPYFLFGWTGQNLKLAWCSAKLGLEQGNPELVDRCRKIVDFYIKSSKTKTKGLRYNHYFLDTGSWQGEEDGTISSRAYGETIFNLGKIIQLFRSSNIPVPQAWTASLCEAADFFLARSSLISEGIFPVFWLQEGKPESGFPSAAGIPCMLGVLKAYKATGSKRYLDGAVSLLEKYWQINGDRFDRPFSRSTLDARCEDKEAGIYFFLAAYELYKLTGDTQFKKWAEVSADWILTFVYFWHTGFRPGTVCANEKFITTGWPGVSVQNHHLDVFFPAYELYDFGRRVANTRYEHLGRMVFDAWSYGICREPGDWEHDVPGEQGEQFYQTNYGRTPADWRGGYHRWNPAWIIGMVLQNALMFRDE
ncbi:MAG TPA: hypothetical protein VM123_06475 [archaeon]|nr:hypothetical protein [archaeon]